MNFESTCTTIMSGRFELLRTCQDFSDIEDRIPSRRHNTLTDIPDLRKIRLNGRKVSRVDNKKSTTKVTLCQNERMTHLFSPKILVNNHSAKTNGDEPMSEHGASHNPCRSNRLETTKENFRNSSIYKPFDNQTLPDSSRSVSRKRVLCPLDELSFDRVSLAKKSEITNVYENPSLSNIKSSNNNKSQTHEFTCPDCSKVIIIDSKHHLADPPHLLPNSELNIKTLLNLYRESKSNEKVLSERIIKFEEVLQKVRQENREMRSKIAELNYISMSNLHSQEALSLLEEEKSHRQHLQQEVRLLTRDLADVRAAYNDLVNSFNRNQLIGFQKQKYQNSEFGSQHLQAHPSPALKNEFDCTEESQIVSKDLMDLGGNLSGLTLDSRFAGKSDIFDKDFTFSKVDNCQGILSSNDLQTQHLHFLSGQLSSKMSSVSQSSDVGEKLAHLNVSTSRSQK